MPKEPERASDVERDGDGWSVWIRMTEIKLGPYPTRAEALAAEAAYLSGGA